VFGSGVLTRRRWVLSAVLLAGALAGCTATTTTTSTTARMATAVPTTAISAPVDTASTTTEVDLPLLRIVNTGTEDLLGLTVVFPESQRIEFGDVAAGETSEYRVVPTGVYRYAAYEYQADDGTISQPVTDWVGELPMAGSRFTYKLAVRSGAGLQVELVEVVVDVP
jgi:hypothetical protein